MTPEERFNLHKEDARYNTSYPLRREDWSAYRVDSPLSFADARRLSFYIHIPFCKSICRFCEYVKYPIPDETTQLRYLRILDKDIANFINGLPEDAVLEGFDIGGGTPTALSNKAFVDLLLIMNDHADSVGVGEGFSGSIEASFSTIDEQKIESIASIGRYINRISFGLQNVSSTWLAQHNRDNGSVNHIISTIDQSRQAGIKIINIDLMHGFANQTTDSFSATLDLIGKILPEHVTLYELRTNMICDKRCASATARFEQYCFLYNAMIEMGYSGRFGCNTFSLIGDDGVSSYLHNRMVPGGLYKGFGIAAQSKSANGISYNIGKHGDSLEECLAHGTFEGKGDNYILPPEEIAAKYVAICGYCGQFSLSKLREITAHDFADEIRFLTQSGLVTASNDTVILTKEGFKHYGAVLSLFYPNI